MGAIGGFRKKRDAGRLQKTPENADTMAEDQISSFRLLPGASVCFHDRLAAVASLVSELYPIDGVGKLGGWGGGGGEDFGKRDAGRRNKKKRGYQGGE